MDLDIDNPGVKRSLTERIKIATRQKRYKLHQHFLQYATVQEAKNNKPKSCPYQQNWEELCDLFASDEYKRKSEVNRNNRQKVQCIQTTGRKAFTVLSREIYNVPGESCDAIELYERGHRTEKDGWKSEMAKKNWEMMIKKREEYVEQGIEKTEDKIRFEVLGHGTGYVKGLGYGPKPPSRRNPIYDSSSQYKDELKKKTEELEQSNAHVQELHSQVTDLKSELSSQGETINKLMAIMAKNGMEF